MSSGERAKILIVDDLADNLLVYQSILETLHQELVLVHSGEEALKEVLRDDFAVILLDVNMPGIDGLETAALIRTRKKSAHTPIIFLTAFTDDLRISEGYAQGAVDFISTPVVPGILRAKVKVFVDLFHLNRQIKQHAEERVAHAQERSKLEAAEESNRRLTFLARAGAVIAKSLDRVVTIESMLRLLVPEHAAQALVAERDATGSWRAIWARHDEPLIGVRPADFVADLPPPWRQAIQQAGETETTIQAQSASAENGSAAAHLLALPLGDREGASGVLLLVASAGGGYFSADVAMFEAFAWRSAVALVNARLYEEIERADQQKNRFLSMLAHELRNPLAPIRSAVDVLRLCGNSPEDIEWARDVIDRQVNHLVRLVDDLLDISRVTLGKIRLVVEPLDAAEVVTAAVEISRPLIEKGEHQLSLQLPDEPISFAGDRARLTQVLSNLLNNAAKYTPPRGSISLSLRHEGEEVVFRIRDSGIGIPADMLERVFDMFLQIENTLDRTHGGLGIGLTLVREIVNMHHGTITVSSDGPDRGSEFEVRFPCSSELSAEAASGNAERTAVSLHGNR